MTNLCSGSYVFMSNQTIGISMRSFFFLPKTFNNKSLLINCINIFNWLETEHSGLNTKRKMQWHQSGFINLILLKDWPNEWHWNAYEWHLYGWSLTMSVVQDIFEYDQLCRFWRHRLRISKRISSLYELCKTVVIKKEHSIPVGILLCPSTESYVRI